MAGIATTPTNPIKMIPINAVAVGSETTVWTPATGKRFRLLGYVLIGSAQVQLVFKDSTGGTVCHCTGIAANTPFLVPAPSMGDGYLSAAVNNVLTCTSSGACTLSGTLFGTEE